MAKVALWDIVNLPAFEQAADLFYRATGMTLSFPDRNGNIVFYPHSERCGFCSLIQSTEEGMRRCQDCDRRAAEVSLKEGRPMFYTCHAGLMDVVVPIKVGDEKIGCFYSGQFLLSSPTEIGFQDVQARLDGVDVDLGDLRKRYSKVTRVDAYKLEMALELLSIICNHIVQGQIEITRERELTRAAEQKARLERDLREMELRLSQAQLNPHFLFNSLNLMLGEALNEQAHRTAHLVEELSFLLGNALTNIGSLVSLTRETRSAEAYVDIFRARFASRIDLGIDVPRSLARAKVPALILQPLVENALVHGFPKCQHPFRIDIAAARVNGNLQIRVSDNGPGLTRQQCARANRSIHARSRGGKMTGLAGIRRRLRYYYDGATDVRVEPGESGVSVVISLPR